MKKNIYLLIFILVIIPLLNSHAFQVTSKGFKFGANVSNLISDDFRDDPETYEALILGGFVKMPLISKIYLQPEMYFSLKGATWKFSEPQWDLRGYFYDEETYKITYIDMPILARVDFPGDPISMDIFAGPSVGLKIDTSLLRELNGQVLDEVDATINKVKTFDVGYVVGIGAAIQGYGLEFRYNPGLMDIWDGDDFNMKNQTFSILVGLGF